MPKKPERIGLLKRRKKSEMTPREATGKIHTRLIKTREKCLSKGPGSEGFERVPSIDHALRIFEDPLKAEKYFGGRMLVKLAKDLEYDEKPGKELLAVVNHNKLLVLGKVSKHLSALHEPEEFQKAYSYRGMVNKKRAEKEKKEALELLEMHPQSVFQDAMVAFHGLKGASYEKTLKETLENTDHPMRPIAEHLGIIKKKRK